MAKRQTQSLPNGWEEVDVSGDALNTAFALLQGTFPYRYLHLNHNGLQLKMLHERRGLRSLRIFAHPDVDNPTIAAFFFLRYAHSPQAYCLSVGIDTSITSGSDLYNQLTPIVKYMQDESGVALVDIVNQREIVETTPGPDEDNMNDTPNRSTVVRAAFIYAKTTANTLPDTSTGIVQPHSAWPYRLQRWQVVPLP
jgi:hypothetical protein